MIEKVNDMHRYRYRYRNDGLGLVKAMSCVHVILVNDAVIREVGSVYLALP